MEPFENRMPFEIRTRSTIRKPDMSGFQIPTVIPQPPPPVRDVIFNVPAAHFKINLVNKKAKSKKQKG